MKRPSKRAAKTVYVPKPMPANARLIGIALMCGATCSSPASTRPRNISTNIWTRVQVVWARYLGAFLVSFLFLNPWTEPGLLNTKRPWLQSTRSVLLLLSTVLNVLRCVICSSMRRCRSCSRRRYWWRCCRSRSWAKWIGPRRWAAIIVGFFGILIITRPGFGHMHPAAFLTVVGTILLRALQHQHARFVGRAIPAERHCFIPACSAPW